MGKVRILEIKESVFADNDRQADQLRIRLKEKGVFLMNLMSSPGSGKTTTLKRTIAALKDDLRIGEVSFSKPVSIRDGESGCQHLSIRFSLFV